MRGRTNGIVSGRTAAMLQARAAGVDHRRRASWTWQSPRPMASTMPSRSSTIKLSTAAPRGRRVTGGWSLPPAHQCAPEPAALGRFLRGQVARVHRVGTPCLPRDLVHGPARRQEGTRCWPCASSRGPRRTVSRPGGRNLALASILTRIPAEAFFRPTRFVSRAHGLCRHCLR